ncbi:DUF2306 domain-containing protein [Tabrizicola flagellatus]|uniref:DUF2306 domain-containing protein n=1 Tax=Tabrizicola flagellatus TaxID=2593021 RepID=UPI0011F16952|nr:DUF2306 domain-containing protein [Tabrizicola flagellatus]
MIRLFQRPIPLAFGLAVFSAIPVLIALVEVVQIPTGTYPEDSARLAVAPVAWFAHVLTAVAFGVTGPLQFVRALRHRFGALHRLAGRIFVIAGAVLGLSGLALLAQVAHVRTPLAEGARGLFGLALLAALACAMAAIRDGDIPRHRAWIVRAYAIGMGSGAIALVFFPIYVLAGRAPDGIAADILFIGAWAMTIGIAELILRRPSRPLSRRPA